MTSANRSSRLAVIAFVVAVAPLALKAQQTDTSSFFPIGLWSIWQEAQDPPLNGKDIAQQWRQETRNLQEIKANYLVFGVPRQVEDTVVMIADTIQYKVCIANCDFVTLDRNSLIWWLRTSSLSDSGNAITLIRHIRDQYRTHVSFHSYELDDEASLDQPSRWPLIEFVARKIHELDPQRRSVASTGPVPAQQFFDKTPSLDIFQFDQYPFLAMHPSTYSGQQTALDQHLIGSYNMLMDRLRGKRTEWQAIIQSQGDVRPPGQMNLRRPNFYELRIQAYLALSRGARGICFYAYSSARPHLGSEERWGTEGLVDLDLTTGTRRKWELVHPGNETIPAFDNVKKLAVELGRIGPTFRKLRVYEAFPHTSIPAANVARILAVSSDYTYNPRFEIGTFKRIDRGADSTVYFLLVNRVCNNEDGSASPNQKSIVTFSNRNAMSVTEVVSGRSWQIPPHGSLTDEISPGEGKLYEISH